MGFFDLMEGYRKSDALVGCRFPHRLFTIIPPLLELEYSGSTNAISFTVITACGYFSSVSSRHHPLTRLQLGQTYFDGLHNDPESVERLKNKYNYHSSNLLLLRFGNC